MTTSLVVLMACRNRRDTTLRCLRSLMSQTSGDLDLDLRVVVVDDGSTDGTYESVTSSFPGVQCIQGDGQLYWAGGMSLAERSIDEANWDYLLWLNDDVDLRDEAIHELLALSSGQSDGSIIVGPTKWRGSPRWSYGGAKLRNPRRPTSLRPVYPELDSRLTPVDAFNGNIVLIPRKVHDLVGDIDGEYRHAYADIDYGLRARSAGVPALLAGTAMGECDGHESPQVWLYPGMSLRSRLLAVFSRKGIPVGAHWRFVRRHGGVRAPIYFVASYLSAGAAALRVALSRSITS